MGAVEGDAYTPSYGLWVSWIQSLSSPNQFDGKAQHYILRVIVRSLLTHQTMGHKAVDQLPYTVNVHLGFNSSYVPQIIDVV